MRSLAESARGGRSAGALLLAMATGVLYALALPPVGGWPVAWLVSAPLCAAAALARPAMAALAGIVFGIAGGALVSPWLPAMVSHYFEATGATVWLATFAVWILIAGLYYALFCAWLSWALRRGPVSPFVVGAAWWITELVRANNPIVPNPWGLLGYTQMAWPVAAQAADLVGPYGVGAVLAAVGASAAGIFFPGLRGARPRANALALALLVAAQLAYGAVRMQTLRADGTPLRVGIVQGAIPLDDRYEEEHLSANLEHHLALSEGVAREGAQLVFWPELALDFYVEADGPRRSRLVDAIHKLGVDLLAGGLGMHADRGRPRPTNSVFHVSGRAIEGRYDKVHLMPFSEAYPLGDRIATSPIAAGEAPSILRVDGIGLGFAVCSEAMLAHYARTLVREGAELLVTPSIDTWFGSEGAARQQLQATTMRAVETRRYVIRPTASGFTVVVDPRGVVVAQAPYAEPASLVADVIPSSAITPWVRLGHSVALVPLAVLLADTLKRRRATPRSRSRSPDRP
jgi:apolipoprotein N-acyltransferase